MHREVDGLPPESGELAQFMTAAARRYSGSFSHLPRVRYWQIWNEPNMDAYLVPQYANGRPASPDWYRSMVNAAVDAIHSVRKDNVVVAGGLAPFGPWPGLRDKVAPLTFMRQLLCLSSGRNPKPVCRKRVRFDVWAHHPYVGWPRSPDDVSVSDLWKMRVLLDAAARGNLRARSPVPFWVTGSRGTRIRRTERRARRAARALGRRRLSTACGIRASVSSPGSCCATSRLHVDPFQAGLYFRGEDGVASDKPKMALTAFRFPFVAFRQPAKKSVMYWGRSPAGRSAVIVEQKRQGAWRLVETLRPNRYDLQRSTREHCDNRVLARTVGERQGLRASLLTRRSA